MRTTSNSTQAGSATQPTGLDRFNNALANINGIVQDELTQQGADYLHQNDQFGFVCTGVKSAFYETMMPQSTTQMALSVVGGAVAKPLMGAVVKYAPVIAPVLGKEIGFSGKVGASRAGDVVTGTLPNRFSGIQEASAYLKAEGVPRKFRTQILQSFEADSVSLKQAGPQEFGIRYYDNLKAFPDGRYLFETFPATRESLAVKSATYSKETWNDMTYFKQWQIRPGLTFIEGRAATQGVGYSGGQVQKYILNPSKDYIAP